MKQKSFRFFRTAFAIMLFIISFAPFCMVFLKSFQGAEGFSAQPYYQVFLADPQFLMRFWISLILCGCIAVGQLVVSVLAGYGFAKCQFPGRNVLFFFLMILMVLPVQVTLVPNYIMLDGIGLLNTYLSLFLPAAFLPLGTFILRQSFNSVPDSVIDAAKLDGCGLFGIIGRVAMPMNKSGLVCVLLLSFLDAWNMVEQPIAFLEDFERYPISVALAYIPPADSVVQLVCCVLVILPPLFMFTYFNKELVEGITLAEVK